MTFFVTLDVNFINVFFCARFLYESAFCCQNVTREKHFHTKNVCKNVDKLALSLKFKISKTKSVF